MEQAIVSEHEFDQKNTFSLVHIITFILKLNMGLPENTWIESIIAI
jgi:hypothetical protein